MNLFQMKDYKLEIQPEAYGIEVFKKIWDRDKSKDKSKALEELAYVYFMSDYKSDFSEILDPDEKEAEIRRSCITQKKWEPDILIQDAINFYLKMQEKVSLRLLDDARNGINKLSKYMRDINFDEVLMNDKGEVKPKHDIKKFADTVKQIPAILDALKQLEDAVKKEQDAEKGLRGGRKKGMYADGGK